MRWLWAFGLCLWAQNDIWPGRILFELHSGYTVENLPEELQTLHTMLQGTIRLRFPSLPAKSPIYLLEYQANLHPTYVAKLWSRSPAVLYAEPEYLPRALWKPEVPVSTEDPQHITYTPNDLHPNNFCLTHLHVLQAWDSTQGDTNFVVAIVDTDVRFDHPDLIENIAYNWNDPINGIDDDNDGYVDNFHGWDLVGATYSGSGPFSPDNDPRRPGGAGHGTFVAGYAGATTDNGIGIAAPAFKCRVLPVKTAPDNQDILWAAYDGILYAAQKGAHVINCSWGGTFRSQAAQNFITNIVQTYDPLIIAAAGNVPPDTPAKFYPAQYDGVYAVTAVNTADVWTGYVQVDYGIDFATTGEGVTTTGLSNYFTFGTATSFASPQAAGAAVLLRSWRPTLSARQIAELLRITADSVEPANPAHLRYRLGRRINLYRAIVTQDTPACRVQSWSASDGGDNLFYAGETFALSATYINYLSPVANLTVSIESLSPHLQVIQSTYPVGNLGTLQTHTQNTAFTLQVLPTCPPNARIPILFRFTGDGGYADYEVIELPGLNPAYVNLDSAQMRSTICGNGRIGYYDPPANTQGRGALWQGSTQSWLFEGGLVIADDTSAHLSTRGPAGAMFNHFSPMSAGVHAIQGLYETGEVSFMDARGLGLNSPGGIPGKGLSIQGRAYALRHQPANPFVAFLYRIENVSSTPYPDLSVGWWLDFDVGNNPATDRAFVHTTLPLVYARNNASARFIGAVLLSGQTPVRKVALVDTFMAALPSYLGLLRGTAGSSSANGDVLTLIGAQSIALLPGSIDTVAFALVGGNTLAELETNAQEAITWYNCFIAGSAPVVDLGPNRTICAGDSLELTVPGMQDFYWSAGGSQPVIYPATSGLYWALVRDADGCWGYDEVQLTVHTLLPASVAFVPGTTVSPGEPLTGTENSGHPYTYTWRVEGQTYTGTSFTHTFTQPGTYTVWLYRDDGTCSDSLSWQIVVSTTSVLAQAESAVHLYPNPTTRSFQLSYTGIPLEGETLQLYDAAGHLLWITTVQQPGAQYNLPENLPTGLYFWEVKGIRGRLLYTP